MFTAKRHLPALLTLAACCIGASAVSAVTIISNNVSAYLRSSAGNGNAIFSGTNIPTSQLLDVTRGAYYSRTQIDYTGSGDDVTLLNAFDQKRSGNQYDFSEGFDSSMSFTVEADSSYTLSGAYGVTDVSSAGYLQFVSYLYDQTAGSYLAYSAQYSQSTLNEGFVFGGLGGDSGNTQIGALTGTLISGHQYQWYFDALTYAYYHADGGATATGFVRLDIGGGAPSSVPDGGMTVTMLGLTVLSLAACRRQISRIS